VKSVRKKLTSSYFWLRNALPYIIFLLLIVTSCGLPGIGDNPQIQDSTSPPTRIVAGHNVARELQTCFDTYPLVPDTLFKSATALIADMLDSPDAVTVNQGQIRVYISYIVGSDSFLKDAFSWLLDAIPDDPPMPSLTPTPSTAQVKGSSYDLANAQATVQAGDGIIQKDYYAKLNANHALLSSARAMMKKYASRLLTLPNINSPSPEDVGGCLLSAANRMAGFVGRKTIILSSPLAEDASTLPFIDLNGISIEVINWQCVFTNAAACIASRNAWQARLLSFHAVSVSIHDPQQSQVVKPTF
jgi:hypothetical protein